MKLRLAALCALGLALAACSSEPEPVYAQPTFDKAGNAYCPGGYVLATLESGATVCAPVN